MGTTQLQKYLSATHKTRHVNERKPVYGIVTVWKYMRIYKYSQTLGDVIDRAPRSVKRGAYLDFR